MHSDPALPRQTRSFIVLAALLQGGLMYLAQKGAEHGWWPFSGLGGRVCWYTLVLTVPTAMALSVQDLRDARFWRHAAALSALFLALAAWAGWNATGAPGLRSSQVLGPFGAALAIGLFVALPWLQCRLAHGNWRAPYPALFEHAWQNALTLALAALFTGICWAVLYLWGRLFALVDVHFFRDLFGEDAFVHLATGAMAGLGILIGRTQQRPVQVARQILFAVFKGLLPLLAFIAVLFVASLLFTGLEPLWRTRSAATLLVNVVVLLVVFANAVYQDGEGERPYPAWLRRMVEAGLLVLPLYAGLALYAMGLRIAQYGWTADRFWAGLVAVVAALYALGYAWSVLRSRGVWLGPLRGVNMVLSWMVMALVVLANSPALDAQRISAASQAQRLREAAPELAREDLAYLRFDLGRRGYRAVQALRTDPAFAGDAGAVAELDAMLRRSQRWNTHRSAAERERTRLRDADQARALIVPAEGGTDPGDAWWQALVGGRLDAGECLQPDAECVVLVRDLDDDGRDEALLCSLAGDRHAQCRLHAHEDGGWEDAGRVGFWSAGTHGRPDLRQALRTGQLQVHHQRWPALSLGQGTAPQHLEPPPATADSH
ncbi:DUF4153 domain-containing protein [Pseudoxanthomonas broegbernensis]|uniref:DUF4153 domain-containing protein n=1 Tax=Pseudoxanthomonas broegbernensis TaxID=83619 RepID=A0A7V8GP70_9GAMM|nr:DUF4153 domain-containing protein [Pseudoxanthomonas broegbernensis]KAF1687476.1 DUF4153 domain-containing protein [Pseudoxanthomonas broegbernensis]MBB6064477.1 hypothetical protein [Pseudoxanthomonas broegbernensis]